MGEYDGVSNELPKNLDERNFRWTELPLENHPAPIVLPTLPQAGILSGIEYPEGELSLTGLQAHMFEKFESNKGEFSQMPLIPFRPDAFARMLAKIAHGLAIAELGFDSFDPLLPPYIVERRSDYNRVLGSARIGRLLRDETVFSSLHSQQGYIVAHIQLFAQHMRNVYEVVVGHCRSESGWSVRIDAS